MTSYKDGCPWSLALGDPGKHELQPQGLVSGHEFTRAEKVPE